MGLICYEVGVCCVTLGMSREDVPYFELGMSNQAVPYFKKAIDLQCRYLNASIKDVQNGRVHDETLGTYLKDYGICCLLHDEADGFEVIKLAALCGNQEAIAICRESNINYKVKSSISNKLFE